MVPLRLFDEEIDTANNFKWRLKNIEHFLIDSIFTTFLPISF